MASRIILDYIVERVRNDEVMKGWKMLHKERDVYDYLCTPLYKTCKRLDSLGHGSIQYYTCIQSVELFQQIMHI